MFSTKNNKNPAGSWEDFAKQLQSRVEAWSKSSEAARSQAEQARSRAEADRNTAEVRLFLYLSPAPSPLFRFKLIILTVSAHSSLVSSLQSLKTGS